MASDDQEVEAWYLEGWCFFLMAEHVKETGENLDDLGWEELARDARDCLETCQMVRVSSPLIKEISWNPRISYISTKRTLTHRSWNTLESSLENWTSWEFNHLRKTTRSLMRKAGKMRIARTKTVMSTWLDFWCSDATLLYFYASTFAYEDHVTGFLYVAKSLIVPRDAGAERVRVSGC